MTIALVALSFCFFVAVYGLVAYAKWASQSRQPDGTQGAIVLEPPEGAKLDAYTPVPFVLEPSTYGSLTTFTETNRAGARAMSLLMRTGVVLTLVGVGVAIWFAAGGFPVMLPLAFSACMGMMGGAAGYEVRRSRGCTRTLSIDDREGDVRFAARVGGFGGRAFQSECSMAEAEVLVHTSRLGARDAHMAVLWMPSAWFMLGCLFDRERLIREVRRALPAELGDRFAEGPPLAKCRVIRRI